MNARGNFTSLLLLYIFLIVFLDYPFAVLVTKSDEKFGECWDNAADQRKMKLKAIPENDTFCVENYTVLFLFVFYFILS